MSEMINITLKVISLWKKVALCSLLYYLLLSCGFSITMLSIKVFITISIIVANIIDIYLLGVMVVAINYLLSIANYGLIISSYLLYLFLTRMEVFLITLFMLESFSTIFQSITLSNRFSINILAGCLLITLLSLAVIISTVHCLFNSIFIMVLFIIFSFEICNSFVQLFIINLLAIEYVLQLFNIS